jgi:trans-aconitate methyltransferase
VRTRLVDFDKGDTIEGKFHLLVSSMTLHHVQDTEALLKLWFDLLLPGGLLAAADLDTEDGSFHGDNTGVLHLGFERTHMQALLEETGFREVRATTATSMEREIAGGREREFSMFLITGKKKRQLIS